MVRTLLKQAGQLDVGVKILIWAYCKLFIYDGPCKNLHFSAYGSLTVRSLLDTREHCMEEFHFVDPYSQVSITDL